MEQVAHTLQKLGAKWCGVARIEEALILRESGITMNILVLGYTSHLRVKDAQKADIHLAVYDSNLMDLYGKSIDTNLSKLKLHAKIDTGMGRLGIPFNDAVPFIEKLWENPAFELVGCFTHFACADEPEKSTTDEQIQKFIEVLSLMKGKGIIPKIIHASNSAATLNFPQAKFDLVRSGISLYGLTPAQDMNFPLNFKPALAWKTRLISIKEMPENHGISYGHKYFTKKGEKIGVIAVGYGDGMRRVMGNEVLIKGKKIPVVGNVCMDQCMVNLDSVPEASIGDEVVLIGEQNGEEITATEIAAKWGTINYEVICGMAARMPRIYIK
jgi:alanine racemase